MADASLEITADGQRRVVELDKPTLSIGRQSDNDIVIEDTKASRRHCVLEMRDGGLVVRDLNSRNGTWMGENRILEAELGHDEGFRIGTTEFRVRLPEEARRVETARQVEPVRKALPVKPAQRAIETDDPDVIEILPPDEVEEEKLPARPVSAGGGPLARQLAPLLKATPDARGEKGMPNSPADLRLMDRQSRPLKLKEGESSRPAEAIHALQQLLFAAFRTRATDIHIEPKESVYAIRFRIDGLMHAVGEINRPISLALLNVVKILCQADIAKRSVVQEGNFSAELSNRRVDFRVSLTPSTHGQKLALRILDKASVPSRFEDLGLDEDMVGEMRRVCGQDAGLIVVSGPTGSGKTTTLYTALKTIDARRRNVVTIEDPIEYQMEHATQIPIDPTHGVTFASVLSSILRQDPDVILVGEIRDRETATMAMQAATTGHLVFTTVHARDTIGTIFRLLDLGAEPFQVANAMSLAITQRLIRVLCAHCKRPYRPDARQLRELRLDDHQKYTLYTSVGCSRCMNTGFWGRMAVFEILSFTPALRDVILTRPTIGDIRKSAGDWMFRTLQSSGYRRVLAGLTTFEEVERVATGD